MLFLGLAGIAVAISGVLTEGDRSTEMLKASALLLAIALSLAIGARPLPLAPDGGRHYGSMTFWTKGLG